MGSGPSDSWRGWAAQGGAARRPVVSARLDGRARPRNRLFPKTRSWFALDAPLELLSPLSVLRALFVLAAVSWSLFGLTAQASLGTHLAVGIVSLSTALVWIGLLVVHQVGVQGCRLLVAFWTVAVGVLVWAGHGSALVGIFSLSLVPIAVFTALFLGRRAVVVGQGVVVLVLGLALTPAEGVLRAAGLAVFGAVFLCVAPVAVLLLARSARRHHTVDPDTGLPNGFGLAQVVADRYRGSFLVATVAVDGVGHAREALGYQVGTELLRRAVEDLGQLLPPEATIGRVDGDELVVILELDVRSTEGAGGTRRHHRVTDHLSGDAAVATGSTIAGVGSSTGDGDSLPADVDRAGRELADTLARAIAAGRYLVGSIDVPLRAYVGLVAAPWDGNDVAELVRRASLSARRAVDRGLPLVRWDGDRGALTVGDLELLADLRLAPERGELTVAYQPQVAAAGGEVRAVEALLRWTSASRGSVSPGRFIPLAERTGLIDGLTDWVVGEALDAQVRWRRTGVDLPVSVNLSAKSLASTGLSGWILGELESRHLPSSCLTIEVTETAVADPTQALAVLLPLHRQGVRISLDDFGTGFTSLAHLPTLPLDELKVDQSFVLRSPTSPADEAIVRTVGELAHRLGLQVVAEGVETAEIADSLRSMGIDLLQGYHFARPMSEDALLALVAEAERPAARPSPVPTTMVVPPTRAERPQLPV